MNFVSAKIQMDDRFFLVIRRGATLQRKLAIWDLQSKKMSKEINGPLR